MGSLDFFSLFVYILLQLAQLTFASAKNVPEEYLRIVVRRHGAIIEPNRTWLKDHIRRLDPLGKVVLDEHLGVEPWIVTWNCRA